MHLRGKIYLFVAELLYNKFKRKDGVSLESVINVECLPYYNRSKIVIPCGFFNKYCFKKCKYTGKYYLIEKIRNWRK